MANDSVLSMPDESVPLVFDVDSMLTHFEFMGAPTAEELETACARVGRIPACALLFELHSAELLTADAATAMVGCVWSMSEYPDTHLDHADWRDMFALAGYTIDGVRAARPVESIRLYRGSVYERRRDWSWTASREIAERYASGDWYYRPEGELWTAVVEPRRLLARNTERGEDEYVVDTDGLTIEDAT